jgi:hypothetical protein
VLCFAGQCDSSATSAKVKYPPGTGRNALVSPFNKMLGLSSWNQHIAVNTQSQRPKITIAQQISEWLTIRSGCSHLPETINVTGVYLFITVRINPCTLNFEHGCQ